MTPFLLYIGRSSLYLALFYAFFLLAMRRTTFFRLNRILLLAGTLACFLLPFLRLRTIEVQAFTLGVPMPVEAAEAAPAAQIPAINPWIILYVAGFLAVLAQTVIAVVRMRKTIRSGSVQRLEDGTKLVLADAAIPSFSWGRTIVMNRKDAEADPVILLHEQAHIQKAHTLDILFFTAVTLVHWFNPLVWITLSELRLLHEYEADDAVLDKGVDATQYQLLLVRKAVGDKHFTLANGFQHAKLKNRIEMMLKNPTSGWRRLSWLAILPFLAGTMFLANPVRAKVVSAGPVFLPVTAAGQPEAVAQVPDTTNAVSFTLLDPECKPKFNGKDAAEFSKWFYENVQYPEAAKQSGAQGRITVQFTIGMDGKVGDVKVLRGVDPELDAEVVRVVSASPDWTPGTVNGKPVKVNYLFPVIFKTQDTKKEAGQEVESSPGITIRGTATDSILVIIDGKPGYTLKEMKELDINTVESIQVLKEEAAVKKYGEKARNGAIEVMTKKKK